MNPDHLIQALLNLKAVNIKGEFWIETPLSQNIVLQGSVGLLPELDGVRLAAEAARLLGLSFLAVCPDAVAPREWQGARTAGDIAILREAGLSVICLIPGGFTRLSWEWGLGETLSLCANRPEEARDTILHLGLESLGHAERMLDSGASAVVLAEDVAYESGLFLRTPAMTEVVFPEMERIVRDCSSRVALHSDGDVLDLMPHMKNLGFAAIHSVENTGRMSLAACLEQARGEFAVLGGLPDRLLPGERHAAVQAARDIERLVAGLPYCFGSTSGILRGDYDACTVLSAYAAFEPRRTA